MAIKDLPLNELQLSQINEAADQLNNHGVVAFPTETVMGVGVVYDDAISYTRLNQIKRRPEDKPYSLLVESPDQISFFAEVDNVAAKIIKAFLPGPLTLLLPVKKGIPEWVTHGGSVIGVRVSSHPITQALLTYVGKPLLAPSANRSGLEPAMNSDEVKKIFGDELDYIVEGEADGGVPSTILDLTDSHPNIIRKGPITEKMINEVINNGNEEVTVVLGADHGGLEYKNEVRTYLKKKGYKVIDVGTNTIDSCHYPQFGAEAARKVASGEAKFGVVFCTSGEGICIAANKIKGIRCGIGFNNESSRLLRKHNDANMIAFGSKFTTLEDVFKRIDIFLNTNFEGGRHQKRVDMISDLEK